MCQACALKLSLQGSCCHPILQIRKLRLREKSFMSIALGEAGIPVWPVSAASEGASCCCGQGVSESFRSSSRRPLSCDKSSGWEGTGADFLSFKVCLPWIEQKRKECSG